LQVKRKNVRATEISHASQAAASVSRRVGSDNTEGVGVWT
jgi:hypothetical protein